MDTQLFVIVKAELKKLSLLDDIEDGEEETFDEAEGRQRLGLTQVQNEPEDMQNSFERMILK